MHLVRRAVILVLAAAAFATIFEPSQTVRVDILAAFGNPKYEGLWVLIPHMFLYTTLTSLACAVVWILLMRLGWLPPEDFGLNANVLMLGLLGGALALALLLGLFQWTAPDAIHWIPPKPWAIAGNVFSNFYEEFIYRGFLLVALAEVVGFWPAAVATSVLFGAMHTQYPPELQAVIAISGLIWCIVKRAARSLWAPYVSHMSLDIVGDSLIG